MKKIITLSLATLVFTSCATLVRKEFTQEITFASVEPKEAYLYINGEYKGVTPVTLELDSRETYDVKYTKRGYLPNKFELEGRIQPKYVAGDFFMGAVAFGWIPMIVDHQTGKWKAFDQEDVDYRSSSVYWSKMTEDDIELYRGEVFEIENLYFELDKAVIKTSSYDELNEVVAFMKRFPTVKFEVRGHTDSQGEDAYNQKLSEDRAASVVKYITDQGIDASRLTKKGYGETMPVATNDTEEGRARNRRVEFRLD